MSEQQKKEAHMFAENFKKLNNGDRRYVEGWMDAKNDTNTEKEAEEKRSSKHKRPSGR